MKWCDGMLGGKVEPGRRVMNGDQWTQSWIRFQWVLSLSLSLHYSTIKCLSTWSRSVIRFLHYSWPHFGTMALISSVFLEIKAKIHCPRLLCVYDCDYGAWWYSEKTDWKNKIHLPSSNLCVTQIYVKTSSFLISQPFSFLFLLNITVFGMLHTFIQSVGIWSDQITLI